MLLSTTVLLISLSLLNAVNGGLTSEQKESINNLVQEFKIPDNLTPELELILEKTYKDSFYELIMLLNIVDEKNIQDVTLYGVREMANLNAIRAIANRAEGFCYGLNYINIEQVMKSQKRAMKNLETATKNLKRKKVVMRSTLRVDRITTEHRLALLAKTNPSGFKSRFFE